MYDDVVTGSSPSLRIQGYRRRDLHNFRFRRRTRPRLAVCARSVIRDSTPRRFHQSLGARMTLSCIECEVRFNPFCHILLDEVSAELFFINLDCTILAVKSNTHCANHFGTMMPYCSQGLRLGQHVVCSTVATTRITPPSPPILCIPGLRSPQYISRR